jgi:hypothetical protein
MGAQLRSSGRESGAGKRGFAVVGVVGLVLASLLFSPSKLSAAILTQTQSVPLTPTDWSTTLVFSQFNPALGTLNSITIMLDGTIVSELIATNTGATTDTGTVTATATITVTRPDSSTLVVAPTVSHTETLDPGNSFDVTETNSASNAVTSPPPASDLVAYTGVGTIGLPISAVGSSTVTSGNGNVAGGALTSASATVTLVYQYDPALMLPEPPGVLVFGLALAAGLAFFVLPKARFGVRWRFPASL